MITELKVVSDIYTAPNAKGQQKLIKQGVVTRLLINTTDIRYVEEVFDKKGKVLKDTCGIKVADESMRVKHSFEEIKKMVCPDRSSTGFKTN